MFNRISLTILTPLHSTGKSLAQSIKKGIKTQSIRNDHDHSIFFLREWFYTLNLLPDFLNPFLNRVYISIRICLHYFKQALVHLYVTILKRCDFGVWLEIPCSTLGICPHLPYAYHYPVLKPSLQSG